MPEDCNVQIDPTGDVIDAEELIETIEVTKQNRADIDSMIQNANTLGDVTINNCDFLNLPKVVGWDWIYKGTEAPSRTPDFIGQFYIDTTNKIAYLAVGVANSSDYKRITN